MKLKILSIIGTHELWFEEALGLYQKKIQPMLSIEYQILKAKKMSRQSGDEKKELESKLILEKIKPNDYLVLLDEAGKTRDSLQWAKWQESLIGSSRQSIVFVLGGAFGSSIDLKKRSNEQISLSALTFNHLLAHIVLLEQVYRSEAIRRGLPYHNK